jgi:uncharacterized membrane-anchored protein YitT (DUF2179 family)
MGNLGMQELFIIIALIAVVGVVLNVVPYWFIFKKAGYHPALSLLMVIPFADIIMKFFLAFAEWPSLKKGGEERKTG